MILLTTERRDIGLYFEGFSILAEDFGIGTTDHIFHFEEFFSTCDREIKKDC